ncbi:MAG: 1-acyl-sn-glycerol-3-phosphate acyltransferase [Anaeroplasmataceae bacterium]|nr:1-acyl-sn-glycerol-3-phosphate acyltransferase [Anaeroplasmataceae bacterium]
MKAAKKTGAIIYGNHTTLLADAFVPNLIFSFRRNYIVVSPETTSIWGIRTLLGMLGAMPLTEKLTLKKKFIKALRQHLSKKKLITIYPEAHIWPYYTKIRPFDDASFKYAALFDKPVFALTNCYQKRKFGKKPKIVTYYDGPFYPKPELNTKENAAYLRDLVYQAMVDRTEKYSTYSYIEYIQIKDEEK